MPSSQKTRKHRLAVYCKTSGHCYYCGNKVDYDYHIDHFIPSIRGGTDDLANLFPACPACNLAKKARTIDDFRRVVALGYVRFDDAQIDLLKRYGVWDGIEARMKAETQLHKFWFEKEQSL